MQPVKYDLYPSGQLSVVRSDAQQYIANVSLPLTTSIRQDIENYLTSFNRRIKILFSFLFCLISFFSRIWSGQNSLRRISQCLSNSFLSCGKRKFLIFF